MSESTQFKVGDWVRCLRNEASLLSPNHENQQLSPYEGFRIYKIDKRSNDHVFYLAFQHTQVILAKDVELIESCICAGPVLRQLGCRCGYKTMLEAKAKAATDNAVAKPVVLGNGQVFFN
jgi:hypothetical protein